MTGLRKLCVAIKGLGMYNSSSKIINMNAKIIDLSEE